MEIQLNYANFGNPMKLDTPITSTDKFSKLKDYLESELGISKTNCLLLDEKGIDLTCINGDTEISQVAN